VQPCRLAISSVNSSVCASSAKGFSRLALSLRTMTSPAIGPPPDRRGAVLAGGGISPRLARVMAPAIMVAASSASSAAERGSVSGTAPMARPSPPKLRSVNAIAVAKSKLSKAVSPPGSPDMPTRRRLFAATGPIRRNASAPVMCSGSEMLTSSRSPETRPDRSSASSRARSRRHAAISAARSSGRGPRCVSSAQCTAAGRAAAKAGSILIGPETRGSARHRFRRSLHFPPAPD